MTIAVDFENPIAVLKNAVDQFIVGGPRASAVREDAGIFISIYMIIF